MEEEEDKDGEREKEERTARCRGEDTCTHKKETEKGEGIQREGDRRLREEIVGVAVHPFRFVSCSCP